MQAADKAGATVKAYRYIITNDDGSAPNYSPPQVTLAICKPKIRKNALPGDLVIAFQGRSIGSDPHAVRWAGVVSERMTFADYWNDSRFRSKRPDASIRGDSIYEPANGQLRQVRNLSHGSADKKSDISGVNVLVFSKAWNFTDVTARRMPADIDLSIALPFRRGHRVTDLDDSQFALTISWLEKIYRGGAAVVALDNENEKSRCRPRSAQRRCRRSTC